MVVVGFLLAMTTTTLALATALASTVSLTADPRASSGGDACDFTWRHPRRYAAHHLGASAAPLTMDGKLDEPAWGEVPFSAPFMDIKGPRHWSQPYFVTRVKMRYDDEMLYIGAYLEETAIWANLTARNSVVFHDNDFEVFVDPDGSTHNYKEIEVNARNTTWNLWLNKPYRNGGGENSTRVDPRYGFDMYGHGFTSGVHVDVPLKDDAGQNLLHYWTVEMALPLAQLVRYTRLANTTMPPSKGSHWRINFSRVEWTVRLVRGDPNRYEKIENLPEFNWVWSPQFAVNMHMPENWGYVVFSGAFDANDLSSAVNSWPGVEDSFQENVPLDPEWNVRFLAFQLYYAQDAYHQAHGAYATSLTDELKALFPLRASAQCLGRVTLTTNEDSYVAQVTCLHEPMRMATIQSDSLITVETREASDVVDEHEVEIW